MSFLATGRVHYNARMERAKLLAERYAFAREILVFYRHIARFQKEFHAQLPKLWGSRSITPANGELRSELHAAILLEPFQKFLRLVEEHGPGALAQHSRQLRSLGKQQWEEVLTHFWTEGMRESAATDVLQEFLARAFLQPYAEFIVGAMLPPVLPMTVCRCPRCNSLPLLGILRPEGEGGKRFLQCSFCSQEWEFRRIFCAHCGEEQEQKLPVYTAEQFPHIRMECCETCKFFLRTIDLTKDGNAVPIVDDLAAIPLGLWAEENGYKRIQGNLLGT